MGRVGGMRDLETGPTWGRVGERVEIGPIIMGRVGEGGRERAYIG